MFSTIWILMWEQWRETAKGVGLVSLSLGVYALLFMRVEKLIKVAFSDNHVLALGTAFLPVVGAMALMFLKESRLQVGFAYPRRMLVLPVHTPVLVGTQLVYKMMIAMLLAGASGYLCLSLIRSTFHVWPQVLLFAVAVAIVQALVFLLCGYGTARGLALFVIAFALSLPVMKPAISAVSANFSVAISRAGESMEPVFPEWAVWSAVVSVALWGVLAYAGARRGRREVPGDSVGRLATLGARITYLGGGNEEFASPEAALRWLEWRRGAYLFPWLSLGLGMFLLGLFNAAMGGLESRFLVTFSLLAVGPIVMACLLGYIFTRSDPCYQWFVGPRPLTTQALVRSRLRTGAKAIGSAYALIVSFLLVANYTIYAGQGVLSSILEDLQVMTNTPAEGVRGIAMVAALGVLIVVIVWSMMWLGRAVGVVAWCAGGASILYFAADGDLIKATGATFYNPAAVTFVVTMTALVLAGIVWAMTRAWRRGLISVRTLVFCVVGWVLLGVSMIALSGVMTVGPPTLLILWMVVPLAPLVTLPVTVDWQRHG